MKPTTDSGAHTGLSVTTPEDLAQRYPAVPLHPGITVYPTRWSTPDAGRTERLPREAYIHMVEGARWPEPDMHRDSSAVVLVLLGLLEDEHGFYAPGTRIEAAPGTIHIPRTETGCLLYALYPDR